MWSVPRLSRRSLRWTLITLLLFAAYAAAGFWLVPKLLANAVRDTFSERYQRTAKLGPVTFNPFSFELEARNFTVPDADGEPLFSFERLYVNLGLKSVLRGAPTFQAIALDKPRARIARRSDGSLNLADFISDTSENSDPNSPPPRLWIDDLVIRDGRATLLDQDRPRPLTVELGPITLQVRKFSTRSEGNEYSLTVQSPHGERLSWRGDFGLAPFASHGKFWLRNIQAQTLAEIAGEGVPFQVTAGQLAADGSYAFAGRGKALDLRVDVSQLLAEGLGLRLQGEVSDAVSVPHLKLANIELDLAARTLKVAHVLIDQLHVAALRDRAGELNLLKLRPPSHAPPSAPAAAPSAQPATPQQPWVVSVPEIVLHAGELSLVDQRASQPARFHLRPVDLTVGGFASPSTGPLQLDLVMGVNEHGQFALHGPLDRDQLSGRFALEASTIPLPPLQPYVDELVGFNLVSGHVSAQGTLDLSADRSVRFAGEAGIAALRTTDKEQDEDFVKWTHLKLAGLNVRSRPLSLDIAEMLVSEPYARVVVNEKGATNIQEVLSPRSAPAHATHTTHDSETTRKAVEPTAPTSRTDAPADLPPTAAAIPVEIGLVRVDAGSVNFADRSLKPHFETGIQKLSGTIKGLSARADARADVQLAGEVDRYTPVKITGKVNYFAAVSYTDLHMAFRNLELTSLSPYSGKFAGYRIERGKLKVNLNYLIDKRRLNAKHKIVIDQLQLGGQVKSADATSLPVKLAIALLKDRKGVIDLDIPVSGNLDDPKFRVWPIIWQVVLNLVTKIVTSPFALLGSLFGAGDEISYVQLSPASATLSAASKAKLQTLSKALAERPALNLDLPLVVKPNVDGPALRELRWRAERERLGRRKLGAKAKDAAALKRLLATPKEYRALLEGSYREAYKRAPVIPPPRAVTAPAASAAGQHPPPKAPDKKSASVSDVYAIGWLEQQLKARISVGQSDFDELARQRAQQVQSVVLDGTSIDPARVFVITAEPLAPDAALRMQLSVH